MHCFASILPHALVIATCLASRQRDLLGVECSDSIGREIGGALDCARVRLFAELLVEILDCEVGTRDGSLLSS